MTSEALIREVTSHSRLLTTKFSENLHIRIELIKEIYGQLSEKDDLYYYFQAHYREIDNEEAKRRKAEY